ncbi:MAG TPA: nicotinate-nucleotide adenylyltransferase [Bacilli bacterium]
MNIGIMGGTFDPVHFGHLLAAERAREGARLDEVWFLPANSPPHKTTEPGASGEHRLAMVRLAIQGNPRFRALDLELARGGVSYTVDTAAYLRKRYPDDAFYWIIGLDMVKYLPQWVKIEEIFRMIGFIGLNRPGIDPDLSDLPEWLRSKVTMVEMPEIAISSTDIRRRRQNRFSVRYLVPEPVLQYMEEHHLYES